MTIYSDEFKRLAAAGEQLPLPANAAVCCTRSNPICGDRVTAFLQDSDPQHLRFSFEIRGCLVCKAAAALLHRYCNDHSPDQFEAFSEQLEQLLQDTGASSSDAVPELVALKPLVGHRHRHSCALLPVNALHAAMQQQ